MITIYDLERQPTAILEKAYDIGYSKEQNLLTTAQFTMLADDDKTKYIKPLHFAEMMDEESGEYIGLFRILPKTHKFSTNTNEITYELEDVRGTLFANTLFKYHQFSNFTTREVLQRLLNMQHEKHWKLGDVEFTRYFHYSFENENLLSAILSIPKVFDEPYRWETDTTNYPWTLHLRKPDIEISTRVVQGYNLQGFTMEENPNAIWNRVYALGAGEGVNQLTIESVNNGVPYVEDVESINKLGLYETTWVDRRFTDAESLKNSAKGLLEKWSQPIISWQTNVADLSKLTGIKADKIREGKMCRITLENYGNIEFMVIKEEKSDIKGDYTSINIELGNAISDLGTTQTDLERRQQINELYSQGATNILNFTYQDNADAKTPATIPFYVDDDVVNINTCELTFDTKRFRTYSGITEGGGGVVKSTSSGGSVTESTTSGGGTTRSTTSGGSVSKSTASGGSTTQTSTVNGQSTQTSSAGGNHTHVMFQTTGSVPIGEFGVGATAAGNVGIGLISGPSSSNVSTLGGSGNHVHNVSTPAHSHNVSVPSHTHGFEIPNHSHDVTIPNHSHSVTIPNHTHEIDLPDHTHDVKHEILELSTLPSSVEIFVDDNRVPHTSIRADRLNIVDYLRKDTSGRIHRGQHEIEIKPNGLARIEANLILRVFIQSQLGGQF